jgi:hypothetical protein
MRFLARYILIFSLLFSADVNAKNSIYENLSYFFQDANADLPMVRVFEKNVALFVQDLREFNQGSKKKQIDRITKEIEKKFFKQYRNEADLADFFVSGLHNSISARAIQTIILTELDIPFLLKEYAGGFQLIAYPQSDKIVVEYEKNPPCLPWTDDTKSKAINFLIAMDVVTRSQANSYGFGLIDKHFNSTRSISIQQLAGLDLMKKGLLEIGNDAYSNASKLLTIGQNVYIDNRFGYLKFGTMNYVIDDLSYDNILIVDYLTQIYDLTRKRANLDRLKNNLEVVYNVALNERRDFVFTDSAKSLVQENLSRKADQNLLLSSFATIDIFYYFNHRDGKKAYDLAVQGLAYNPNNLEIQNIFGNLLVQNLFSDEDWFYSELDNDKIMDTLDYYLAEYPFLVENADIIDFSILVKTDQVSGAFNANQPDEGHAFLAELEQLLVNYDLKESNIIEDLAFSYSEIAVYYYREKQYNVALEWVNKAIDLYPDSDSINNRKKNIEDKLSD